MLSILIPTYNFDCSKLVEELYTQCTKANITFEIVVGNDGSTLNLDKLKSMQGSLQNFKLLDYKENKRQKAENSRKNTRKFYTKHTYGFTFRRTDGQNT